MQLVRVATYWDLPDAEVAVAADGFADRAEAEDYIGSLKEIVIEDGSMFLVNVDQSRRQLDGSDTMIREPHNPNVSRWHRKNLMIEGYCRSAQGKVLGKLGTAIVT